MFAAEASGVLERRTFSSGHVVTVMTFSSLSMHQVCQSKKTWNLESAFIPRLFWMQIYGCDVGNLKFCSLEFLGTPGDSKGTPVLTRCWSLATNMAPSYLTVTANP